MMRLPLSASDENAGPASNSRSCPAVCTWIARPWPTSSTVIAAVPVAGRGGSTVSSGRKASTPSQREGKPRGSSSQRPPASASSTAQTGGAACCHIASGRPASQSMKTISQAVKKCASVSNGSSSGRLPSSASGAMTKLTSGIASALASGETSENCWNRASSAGSMPSVTAHCARPHSSSQCTGPSRPLPIWNSSATAPKDSQKPPASTAHGSSSRTSSSASDSTREPEISRAERRAAATTASM